MRTSLPDTGLALVAVVPGAE
jgi:hypothetical protein